MGWWPHGWPRQEAEWGWEGSAALLRYNFALSSCKAQQLRKKNPSVLSVEQGPPRTLGPDPGLPVEVQEAAAGRVPMPDPPREALPRIERRGGDRADVSCWHSGCREALTDSPSSPEMCTHICLRFPDPEQWSVLLTLTSLGTGGGRTRAWHSRPEGPALLPRTRPVSYWWLRGMGVVPFGCLKSPSCRRCVGSWFEVPFFLVGLSHLSRFPGCSPEWTLRCLRSLKQIPDHAAPSATVIEGGGQWTQGSPCPFLSSMGLCGALTDGVALGTSQVVGHPGSWPKALRGTLTGTAHPTRLSVSQGRQRRLLQATFPSQLEASYFSAFKNTRF